MFIGILDRRMDDEFDEGLCSDCLQIQALEELDQQLKKQRKIRRIQSRKSKSLSEKVCLYCEQTFADSDAFPYCSKSCRRNYKELIHLRYLYGYGKVSRQDLEKTEDEMKRMRSESRNKAQE